MFTLKVPLRDPDIVEFISTGVREVTVYRPKVTARVAAALTAEEALGGQLEEAVLAPDKLKPTGSRTKASTVIAHCHGVFLLPDRKNLCVLVGRSKPDPPDAWISTALKAGSDALLLEHQSRVAEFDIEREKRENDDLYAGNSDMKKFEGLANGQVAMKCMYQRPVLTGERLVPLLPRAANFPQPRSRDTEKLARAAIAAIAASGWPPARDGNYVGILPGAPGRRAQGLVSWVPHTGLPSYPEVRWAIQKRLPAALRKPRIEQMGKPKFDTGAQPVVDSVQMHGIDPESSDLTEALDNLELDQSDYRNRVDDVRKGVKGHGFEAIAWFQPYHVWTEETWGIYFDARKLDDLALSFLDDFRSQQVHGSHSLAALLAVGLTYAHELFHARVEAALSWMEVSAQQPRHLRYQERVYQARRGTPEWLEEALANWSAWSWFKTPGIQSMVNRMSNAQGMERLVEASLDHAPAGYKEWRLGDRASTWRTFANQLSTGNPKIAASGIGLPLESTLTGPLPYDFLPSDIPLRFVGPGAIADRLQSHPATLNVISRRELQKALKFYRHVVDVSAGDGSHEKWTGPDNRAFPLPRKDPVSYKVFKAFLHYIGIDKTTYVHKVRPKL